MWSGTSIMTPTLDCTRERYVLRPPRITNSLGTEGYDNGGYYWNHRPIKHNRCVPPLPNCADGRLVQQWVSLDDGYILDVPVFIDTDLHNHVSHDAGGFRLLVPDFSGRQVGISEIEYHPPSRLAK